MKTIEELRALHAACLPGKWEPLMTCGRLHVCAPTSNNDVATVAIALEPVASFIATAHNEFPAMLDEIERLRNEVVERGKHTLALETALCNLLCVINDDKDGGFFICEEARDRIEDAQKLLG